MDFTSNLFYSSGGSLDEPPQRMMATVRDARATTGVERQARDATERLLDGAGFLLAHAPSKVKDWTSKDDVGAVYYDEALALIQALLPAAEFTPLTSHTYRNEDIKEHYWVDGIQYGPCAAFVHNDYADFLSDDRTQVARSFPEVMDMPTDRRVIGINIWRSVTETPLQRNPLIVCDRTSIDPDDLVYQLNPNAPKPFNAHYCTPNEQHRWHYYSDMTRDEALVFTTYDSHPTDGQIFRPTLHTSAPIPDTDGLTPRQSVEIRFFGYI